MKEKPMSKAAREKRNEYYRNWNQRNPGKAQEYQRRHWERVAAAEKGRGTAKENG